jgi:hypothetical protein
MIRLSTSMQIGDYNFDFVNDIEITSTWEELTDRATIKVPRRLRLKKDGQYTNAFTAGASGLWRRGDAVKIFGGYDDNNDLRFDGVLTRISPKLPLEFSCEDAMFSLKQKTVSKYSVPSTTVKALLQNILPDGITFDAEDITLGKFKIEKATVAEVLDYLRRKFGLACYFQNGVLHVGFAYKVSSINDIATDELVEFEFQRNIIDDSNLDYIRDDDVRLKVTAICIRPNNTRKEIEVGDPDGDIRTLHFYNVSDADLTKLANEALERLKYEGFRGSFTTFLQPMVQHGQAVRMIDPLIPDRNGVYLVRQVVTSIGMGGGRQEITLDRKIA